MISLKAISIDMLVRAWLTLLTADAPRQVTFPDFCCINMRIHDLSLSVAREDPLLPFLHREVA